MLTDGLIVDTLQNDTCVLTPDVTPGPYVWPRSQTLRQDATEDQPGVPLWLDIGVLDMATCEPLEGVLVSFWHCNATGSYSSFTGLSPNIEFVTLLEDLNITDYELGTTDLHTDDTTWLRAMWPTDSNGMVEMKTIFPGFYVQRAIHIHLQVYTDWTLHDNGTVTSGNLISTGQLYVNETLSQQVMALEPYASHTQINRTTNAEDSVYGGDTEGGYNPVLDVIAVDGGIENGAVGYITGNTIPFHLAQYLLSTWHQVQRRLMWLLTGLYSGSRYYQFAYRHRINKAWSIPWAFAAGVLYRYRPKLTERGLRKPI